MSPASTLFWRVPIHALRSLQSLLGTGLSLPVWKHWTRKGEVKRRERIRSLTPWKSLAPADGASPGSCRESQFRQCRIAQTRYDPVCCGQDGDLVGLDAARP